MNNRTLKDKAASNLYCQICSRKLIFEKIFQFCGSTPFRLNILAQNSNILDLFTKNGTFKNNGKASCVARFVLLLESLFLKILQNLDINYGLTFHSAIELMNTVRLLLVLSSPLLPVELDYPQFLRPKLSTPDLYEIQSDLYYSHLHYPRTSFIRGFWDQNLVRPSTANNRV